MLGPLSTTSFSWEDPYGQKLVDAEIYTGTSSTVSKFDFDKQGVFPAGNGELQVFFHVVEVGDTKVGRFVDGRIARSNPGEEGLPLTSARVWKSVETSRMENNAAPLELIVELGVVGVSIVDHRPKELVYLYLERVFLSYSTGYDGGTTSR